MLLLLEGLVGSVATSRYKHLYGLWGVFWGVFGIVWDYLVNHAAV